MGRRAEGPKLAWRKGWASVRFTWQGRPYFIATGETDPERAAERAALIYAEVISGRRPEVVNVLASKQPLDELFAEWLESLVGVLDDETVETYKRTYVRTHFLPFFKTLARITHAAAIDEYARARIRVVLRKTMYKELGALRGFLRFCKTQGIIDSLPEWPELPRTSKGKRAGKQRAKANELSEEQVVQAIMSMPVWSHRISKIDRRRFVVRPRFVVAYETGLRPATLDALEVGNHWVIGATTLRIDDDIDKARFGRVVPLTATAVSALEQAVREQGIESGPIFGRHDYRAYLRDVGLDGVESFAAYDLRHARATHLLERGASLSGVAFVHGHTQVTTTSKYVHPSARAGKAALGMGGADLSGAVEDSDSSAIHDQKEKP